MTCGLLRISSGQVLMKPYNFGQARLIVKEMTELLVLDLVRKGVVTKKIELTIGYDRESINCVYKGKSIKGVRAHKIVESGLAQVPEGRHVFLHMTVDENLDMGAYTQPASTIAANKEKVFTLFPRLKERRKQLAGTMSGGEQQMLAMGRALMSNASMLMLDEPSMGLSPLLVQEIFDIIRDIHKEGMTILLVEQNAQMALSVADRAYVLETGRVVMDGTGAELLTNERVRSAYLGG